jgi:ATP-dependent Clp protease ATP-binding subunit ClpA
LYPFERFTEDAKRTLTLAQQEAERLQNQYIGTEHLLLALLRLPSGTAHTALRDLAIETDKVRETIAAVVGVAREKGLTDVKDLLTKLSSPPDSVSKLRMQLQDLRNNLTVAINLQRFEDAARLQKQRRDLLKKLERAEQDWLRKLMA